VSNRAKLWLIMGLAFAGAVVAIVRSFLVPLDIVPGGDVAWRWTLVPSFILIGVILFLGRHRGPRRYPPLENAVLWVIWLVGMMVAVRIAVR
jgi:hypothetical protein